jgi:hypothetical protein
MTCVCLKGLNRVIKLFNSTFKKSTIFLLCAIMQAEKLTNFYKNTNSMYVGRDSSVGRASRDGLESPGIKSWLG